jgi:SAM-dependent methyltransferase
MRQASSPWVARFLTGVEVGGRVLDVACGGGRHIAAALARGLEVTGVDRDVAAARTAFGDRADVTLVEAELEDGTPFPFASGGFAGVIVTNYLWRPILAGIVSAVARDGVLIYETFRAGNERFGKPSNPDFLLEPGELLDAVVGRLAVVAFEEVTLRQPERALQRICAVGLDHGWVKSPPAL